MVFKRVRNCGVWLVSGLVVTVGDTSHLLAAEVAATRTPVAAVASPGRDRIVAPRRTFDIEVLDRFGNPIALPSDVPVAPLESRTRLTDAAIKKLRQDLIGKTFGSDPKSSALAARQLKLLDAVTGKTPAERHAAILRMGVRISEAPANDGRSGMIKTFTVDGKPRVRVFTPAAGRIVNPSQIDPLEKDAGGPSDSSAKTGRWKIDGSNCYWDGNDSGSDQCSPNPGRWKVGTEGGCAFDSYDDGPDQCEPAGSANGSGDVAGYACDGGDCATPAQFDDFCSALADAESEQEAEQADYDEAEGHWCTMNPGECFDKQSKQVSGPSDETIYCYAEKVNTLLALAGVGGVIVTGMVLAASPVVDLGLGAMVAISVTFLISEFGYWGAASILRACLGYSPLDDLLYDERLVV